MEASRSTNIRLRWSQEGNGGIAVYKYTAPLEPGGKYREIWLAEL